ncbi:MAG: hypothetical protein ABIA93_02830 [Candidatus Woesearchaeota archaeon]
MNKKGDSYLFQGILDLFFVGVVVAVAVAIITTIASTTIDSALPAGETAFNRMYYSSNGFSYTDSLGVSHPGTIDLARFDQKVLEEAYLQEIPMTGMKFTLNFDKRQEIVLVNEPVFKRLAPIGEAKLEGKGGAYFTKKILPVTVYDGSYHAGTLTAEVVASKR